MQTKNIIGLVAATCVAALPAVTAEAAVITTVELTYEASEALEARGNYFQAFLYKEKDRQGGSLPIGGTGKFTTNIDSGNSHDKSLYVLAGQCSLNFVDKNGRTGHTSMIGANHASNIDYSRVSYLTSLYCES